MIHSYSPLDKRSKTKIDNTQKLVVQHSTLRWTEVNFLCFFIKSPGTSVMIVMMVPNVGTCKVKGTLIMVTKMVMPLLDMTTMMTVMTIMKKLVMTMMITLATTMMMTAAMFSMLARAIKET